MAGGRPTLYTPELADEICQVIATNPCGLPKICNLHSHFPSPETIRVWRWEKPQFSAKYTEAKKFQSEIMAESIEDVCDELLSNSYVDEDGNKKLDGGLVGHARLVVDSRKWTASKLAPKIYGDRKELDQALAENESIKSELTELRAKLAEKNQKEY